MMLFKDENRWAYIEGDYRFTLGRRWDDGPRVMFLGHNPSKADANAEDATSRRFMGFAKWWGFGSYVTCNIAAYMATDKRELPKVGNPFGIRNRYHIALEAEQAKRIVVCCGTPNWRAGVEEAWRIIAELAETYDLYGIGSPFSAANDSPILTKEGFPVHLLYQRGESIPHLFRRRAQHVS